MVVGIEDAAAEEVVEERDETWALGIVRESGFENVLHGGGVGGDDAVDLAGAEEDGGVGGVVGEDVGGPV